MKERCISKSVLERLPVYLHYLQSLPEGSPETISATAIARALGLGEVQVRKDLGAVSGAGKPRIGYDTAGLIERLKVFLDYDNRVNAVIVGAGKLGNALLAYEGFRDFGLSVLAAFDTDPSKIGQTSGGKPILAVGTFPEFCRENRVAIGIITTPDSVAQSVCDEMIACGIRAVWNFAPTRLKAPEGILVQNENMASSLAVLSGHLKKNRG